jgi:flagellar hook-basal body complex protein FliE
MPLTQIPSRMILDDSITNADIASDAAIAQSKIANLTTDLAAKQATLVSGTNIKTVNGQSIVGSGDLTVGGGGTASSVSTSTTNFNNNLSSADDTVQKALDTIDNLTLGGSSVSIGKIIACSKASTWMTTFS